MNSKKLISIGLIATIFLTGCSPFSSDKIEETPTPTPSIPEVMVEKTTRTSFTPELVLSGTITAKDEITIASEVTGTVAKVLKKEGDKTSEGMTVMNLESQTNLLKASYSSSQIALTNATKALALTKQSSQQEIKKAQIGVKNAEIALSNSKIAVDAAKINYNKIKDSEKFTKNTNISQSESAKKTLEVAEKNLELANKTYTDVLENEKQSELRLIEDIANTLSGILIPLRSDMVFADTLVGASQFRKKDNDPFEIYLAGTSGNLMQKTQDLWNQVNPLLEEFEIRFTAMDKFSYTSEDRQDLEYLLNDSVVKIKRVRVIIRNIEKMLYKSIESTTLPIYQIEEWKQKVLQIQEKMEGQLQSITALQQSLAEFDIQSPQRISSSEINISVMESQLASSKEALSISQNSEGSTDVSLDSDLLAAKNAHKSAENAQLNSKNAVDLSKSQLELVKIQGQLSIQSALAQQDSSRALLDQAALSLSKLTIQSGIKGTVSKVLAFDGDTVSPGTPLLIVSDFSSLKLITDVSVEESFLLKKGLSAKVEVEGIEKEFSGKISVVYPEADKVTRRVRVEILIPNKNKIPANVFATATIKLKREKPQVYIPVSSLISQNPPAIFLVEKDTKNKEDDALYLRKKEIEIGEEKRGMVPVTKGLRPNQFIVIEKYRSLFDGDEVVMVIKEEIKENKKTDKNKEEAETNNQSEEEASTGKENKKAQKPTATETPEWSAYATPKPVATASSHEAGRAEADLESEIDKRLREKHDLEIQKKKENEAQAM